MGQQATIRTIDHRFSNGWENLPLINYSYMRLNLIEKDRNCEIDVFCYNYFSEYFLLQNVGPKKIHDYYCTVLQKYLSHIRTWLWCRDTRNCKSIRKGRLIMDGESNAFCAEFNLILLRNLSRTLNAFFPVRCRQNSWILGTDCWRYHSWFPQKWETFKDLYHRYSRSSSKFRNAKRWANFWWRKFIHCLTKPKICKPSNVLSISGRV